jgi:hypothetical protein
MRGRASAAHSLAAMSANGIGQFEVGVMSGMIGASKTMYIGGVISIIVVFLIWWLVKGVRQYRYVEVPSGAAIDDDSLSPIDYDLRSLK